MSSSIVAAPTPPPPYHVQAAVDNAASFAHHSSVSKLWSTKWRYNCQTGIYPFEQGRVEDFDNVFKNLVAASNDDVDILFNPDAYAKEFFPVAEDLVHRGNEAESKNELDVARDLYLRAAALYRIARFPIVRSPLSQKAWQDGKAAFEKGAKYLDPPNIGVDIPFAHRDATRGDKDAPIPGYLRVPNGEPPSANGWPVVLFICGLDAYRTDHTSRYNAHLAAGAAVLSVEIPGTGDSPAAPADATSPDRQFSSVFDWIASAAAAVHRLDSKRVVARAVSMGGYYGFRIAHTHADRLVGAVAQGGGCHHMFDPAWIAAQNHMEYPFALADALAHKFGYGSVQEYIDAGPRAKFSLEENGILQLESCRLLIVNGTEDSIFPIEDSLLVASRGRVKDVRLLTERAHVGNPGAEAIIYRWIADLIVGVA
ncbi:hypothetical protein HK100_001281 [Physocladia obscura]|uniref:Uncharacterized protein n=1 Tax=Physocladia obscura TaxID=109957 RepID=A0AAD5T7V2_9FUNG|nr:hypothetical protein HK100_001281 [Physocladia obscura]